ncbi:MAG: Jag N-terminal domain-containing protein [Desulfobulbaceae bacterium]|nr:Jag N-terminal domain-containing protein [Desulfobulbaceae bacterium]
MSEKTEYKGKNIEDAITKACSEIGVPREELDIEVVSAGSAGVFGFCKKQAVIFASRRSRESAVEAVAAVSAAPEPVVEEVSVETEVAPVAEVPVREESEEKAGHIEDEPIPSPQIVDEVGVTLNRFFELMDFSAEFEITPEPGRINVEISGEDIENIIGHEGQTLNGLQYLLRKMIGKKFSEKFILSLDAGDYRKTRKEELESRALKLAIEVRENGKNRTIPPLNPAERRIVHMILQKDKTIRSRSIGDGLYKKVLIYLPGKGRKRPPKRKGPRQKK